MCPRPSQEENAALLRTVVNQYDLDTVSFMASESEVIETTVGKVAADLAKRGLDPDDRITITIEPDAHCGRVSSRPV